MEIHDLLPCPFCGGPAKLYHHDAGDGWSNTDWVCCESADCGSQTCLHETPADAIAAWNRRAALAAAKAAGREEGLEEAARVAEAAYNSRASNGYSDDGRGPDDGWNEASGEIATAIRSLKSPPHSTPPTSSKAVEAACRAHGEPVAWLDPSGGINPVILAHHKSAPMLPKAQARYSIPLYRGAPPASPDVAALIERARIKSAILKMGEPIAFGSDAAMIDELCEALSRLSQPGGRDAR